MKIVLGSNALARYPQGGGHWSCFLQYLIGLRALRHDVFWLEILPRSQPEIDHRRIAIFITRMRRLGLAEKCAVVLHDGDRPQVLSHETTYGVSFVSLKETIQETDALWNFHCSIRTPLLHEFKWKALLDVDPGHLLLYS